MWQYYNCGYKHFGGVTISDSIASLDNITSQSSVERLLLKVIGIITTGGTDENQIFNEHHTVLTEDLNQAGESS